MTATEEYSTTLRNLRKKRGLTQSQLAYQLGRNYHTIWSWEKGHHRPPSTILPILARVLEVDEDQVTPPAQSEY